MSTVKLWAKGGFDTGQKLIRSAVFGIIRLLDIDEAALRAGQHRRPGRQSSSAALRHQLTVQALETIANCPLQGSFASSAPGSYAHNVLSAWVDLALFGFLALVALLL